MHRGDHSATHHQGGAHGVHQCCPHQLSGGRLAGRRPRPRGRGFDVRFGTEQKARDVGTGDSIDHRVVRLVDQGPAAIGKTLDEPRFPRGPREVQRSRHQSGCQRLECVVCPRWRQPCSPQMPADVELDIVNPHGAPQLEGNLLNPLPVARYTVEQGLEGGAQLA